MSEVDAQLRNERLTYETDLDLLKEETTLELEVEMEERLRDFKTRKEEEVATQLERQLDKREEIMRNKALIDVRKRESQIRAEIEGQLGLKRAEIRDRLKGLSEKMDSFKEMAEEKMRDAVNQQIQSEIDMDETELQTREKEFNALQSTDTRAEKRQKWMQSISGQAPAAFGAGAMDPSALGARPDGLGAAAGRPMRGIMGQQNQPESRLGLGGMRAPSTSAKPLVSAQPIVQPIRNVRQPMAQPVRNVRQPIGQPPAAITPQEDIAMEEAEVEHDIVQPMVEPSAVEEPPLVEEPIPVAEPVSEPETELPAEDITPDLVPEVESDIEQSSEVSEEVTALAEELLEETILRPIGGVLTPVQDRAETAVITPVGHMLMPAKKRGAPPSTSVGRPTAALRPVKGTLTPVTKKPVKKMVPEDDEEQD